MGARYNRLAEAFLTSSRNLCLEQKQEKNSCTPALIPQFCNIKVGFNGVNVPWTCFPDGQGKEQNFLSKPHKISHLKKN